MTDFAIANTFTDGISDDSFTITNNNEKNYLKYYEKYFFLIKVLANGSPFLAMVLPSLIHLSMI